MTRVRHTKEEKRFFRELFFSSFILENSYNYERQQALGFSLGMWPAIKRIYKDDKNGQAKALSRHMQIFNTAPFVVTAITGVISAMEWEAKDNSDFDNNSINSVKVALMGPFAGIGDSFFWGTLRILATAIALPLSEQGLVLGPILFLLAFNIPSLLIRYWGGVWGYTLGINLLDDISESLIFSKISKAATIVGLMVIGAMSAQMINISTPLAFEFGEAEFLIQSFIDQIFPELLPLLYVAFCYWLISIRKLQSSYVLLITIIIGVGGALVGFL